jgi:sulfate permease, SulP family
VAAAVLPLAAAGSADAAELTAALALMVGGCFLIARALRLGWLADYFSRPVLIGYYTEWRSCSSYRSWAR